MAGAILLIGRRIYEKYGEILNGLSLVLFRDLKVNSFDKNLTRRRKIAIKIIYLLNIAFFKDKNMRKIIYIGFSVGLNIFMK